ncbi:hypothetical protein [Alkalibacterium pelagium]|nr:hypothetical protein [Alkalibacterium pelagium]GEN51731.1 hypothetical protein APE02nite_23960 [Alkalibacterium pelagium]
MQNDPTQGDSNSAVNHPAHQEAANKENKYSDAAEQESSDKQEEIVEDESTPEDYEKFDVDKVDELKKTKKDKE